MCGRSVIRSISLLVVASVIAVSCSDSPEVLPTSTDQVVSTTTLVEATSTIVETTTTEAPVETTEELVERLGGAVVRLDVAACDGEYVGAGFLIDEHHIVTVAHNIVGAELIAATTGDEIAIAEPVGMDVLRDIALLRTDIPMGDVYFDLEGSEPVVGQDLILFGFPLGLDLTVTRGIVSNADVELPEEPLLRFVQIDAAANPGNSGGPVVTAEGDLIGILQSGIVGFDGLSFATKLTVVERLLESWVDGEALESVDCADYVSGSTGSVSSGSTGSVSSGSIGSASSSSTSSLVPGSSSSTSSLVPGSSSSTSSSVPGSSSSTSSSVPGSSSSTSSSVPGSSSSTIPAPTEAEMPNVVGLSKDDAVEAIQNAGWVHITLNPSCAPGFNPRIVSLSLEQVSSKTVRATFTSSVTERDRLEVWSQTAVAGETYPLDDFGIGITYHEPYNCSDSELEAPAITRHLVYGQMYVPDAPMIGICSNSPPESSGLSGKHVLECTASEPLPAGNYRITAMVFDSFGREHQAEADFSVS